VDWVDVDVDAHAEGITAWRGPEGRAVVAGWVRAVAAWLRHAARVVEVVHEAGVGRRAVGRGVSEAWTGTEREQIIRRRGLR